MSVWQFLLALVVATVVFRWQKSIDRETEQKRELSNLYSEYIGALSKHLTLQPFVGEKNVDAKAEEFASISGHEGEIYVLRDRLWLLAPDEVLEPLDRCDKAFRAWKVAFHKEYPSFQEGKEAVSQFETDFRARKGELAEAMRSDLRSHSNFSLKPKGLFRK